MDLPYSHRHPVILSRGKYLTKLLLRYEHGCQAVLSSIPSPLSARSTLRGVIRNCSRAEPRTTDYQIGQLPTARVHVPFFSMRVVLIKERARSKSTFKAYLCLATKAVHLEATTDLTTEVFLNCLSRFLARWSRCLLIRIQ